MIRRLRRATLAILLVAAPGLAAAAQPVVSIVIDDIGDNPDTGQRAVDLPGPVACAFLPGTPYAHSLAERAHRQGKEVLLHQPMQAVAHNDLLGPGALMLHMTEPRFLHTLRDNLQSLPYVVGVNNHMGSLLTRHPGHMTWLMRELKREGDLFYVDSRTTRHTVAEQMAHEVGVPTTRRNVFLDNRLSKEAIRDQFLELVRDAREEGHALAIGHPHPKTLAVLEQEIPKLAAQGVRLVPVFTLLQTIHQEPRTPQWHASASQ